MPDVRPAAGFYLIAGIDAVLPRLGTGPCRQLADELRAALARTAACGDTCRVRDEADGVRTAACLLLDSAVDDAKLMLERVRAELIAPSSRR